MRAEILINKKINKFQHVLIQWYYGNEILTKNSKIFTWKQYNKWTKKTKLNRQGKYFCMDWITLYPITIFTIAYDKHMLKYLLNWKQPLNGQNVIPFQWTFLLCSSGFSLRQCFSFSTVRTWYSNLKAKHNASS